MNDATPTKQRVSNSQKRLKPKTSAIEEKVTIETNTKIMRSTPRSDWNSVRLTVSLGSSDCSRSKEL